MSFLPDAHVIGIKITGEGGGGVRVPRPGPTDCQVQQQVHGSIGDVGGIGILRPDHAIHIPSQV